MYIALFLLFYIWFKRSTLRSNRLKINAYPPVKIVDYLAVKDVTKGEEIIENGNVLRFPSLAFDLDKRFLTEQWSLPKNKNIAIHWPAGVLRGAQGSPEDLTCLQNMMVHYKTFSENLINEILPHYQGKLRCGNTSFRPVEIANRQLSWRKDDTRLHVDAFPSNPTQGDRMLRVFCNVNPSGQPRVWRVGGPFEPFLLAFLPFLSRPWPGWASLLNLLGITKSYRTVYDHYMLQLHDGAKSNTLFQRSTPQMRVEFQPGTTWVCFSDQVIHAAMQGQYLLEQTFYLPVTAQVHPDLAPFRVLQKHLKV